ncbi:substance-P receptor-like [Oculina patagonica]
MSLANETFNQTGKVQTAASDECFVRDSTAVKMLRIVSYCFLLVVSLLGNSVIIAVVWKEQRLRKSVNFFIVNMCVADLLITFYMPRVMSVWYAGYTWQVHGMIGLIFCKLAVFMHQTAICASIFTVVAISCDRFFAVVVPLKTIITKKVCLIIIAIIWFLSVTIRLPMLYGLETGYDNNGRWSCYLSLDDAFYKGAEKTYYKFTLIGLFAVPLSVIAVLYSGILISLKLRKVPGEEVLRNMGREKRRDAMIKRKVLRMVLIVVAVFVLCWLLYFVQLILFSYKIQVTCDVLFLRLFLAHLNSALNPCLYLLLNENFRVGVKNILNRCPLGRCLASSENFTQRVSPSNAVSLSIFPQEEN